MNFWHLVRVVKAKKLVIAGVVVMTLVVILIAAPAPDVVYQASAYVLPTAQVMQGGATTAGNGAPANTPDREVILSNLITLAQGGEVYQRALDFLALPVEEQRKLAPGLPDYRQITRIETPSGSLLTYRDWGDILEATPVQNPAIGENGTTTDIIRISVKMKAGELTPYIANAVGYAFGQTYQEKSREDVRKYARFLQSSREEARAKLHDLQQRIAAYKRDHRVLAVDAETQNAISSLSGLQTQKAAAEAAVREAEAAVRDIDAQLAGQPLVKSEPLPADMNPTVKRLKEELAQAESELRMLGQRYKPAHETYKAAEARIALLKERIAREGASYAPPSINEIHQDLIKKRSEARYELATARARLATVAGAVAEAQAKISKLAEVEPELAELTREHAQAESRYNILSEKYTQALIAEEEFTKTGSLVPYGWARADAAVGPIIEGPTRKALLVYGLVLSLILGVATAVWLDSIDNRMRNASDVEKLLELPVIGLTPKLTGRDGVLPKLTHVYPLSAMAESYRILRTNLLFALRDSPFKTMMVATGRPGQGATTTICNLAIALAQIGKRVILIDADMRRPSLHKFFGVPNEAGLSTLLQGQGALTDAFQKTDIENLIVVPAGPQPMNPSELLGSDGMRDLVKRLEEHCDLVLFDTPSTIVFSDGPILASWLDAVLMVVSANQVPRGTEIQTRNLLRKARANILGVVVNRMAPENVDSCHYYAHYYASSVPTRPDEHSLPGGNGKNGRGARPPKEPRRAIAARTETESEENPFPD